MYIPETSITGFGDSVLVVSTDERYPYRVGRYTGNKDEDSESYEIAVHSMWQEGTDFTAYYHKEDIYENTEANAERLK